MTVDSKCFTYFDDKLLTILLRNGVDPQALSSDIPYLKRNDLGFSNCLGRGCMPQYAYILGRDAEGRELYACGSNCGKTIKEKNARLCGFYC